MWDPTKFTIFEVQRPYWHTALCLPSSGNSLLAGTSSYLALIPFVTAQTPNIVLFGLSLSGFPQDFKTRLLGKGFHTLIMGVSFSSPTNMEYHKPNSYNSKRIIRVYWIIEPTWLALLFFFGRVGLPTDKHMEIDKEPK